MCKRSDKKYTAAAKGRDPRLDIGDIVTIHDKYGGKSKIPIMKLSMDYDGGLITEIESQGKTEIESGSIKAK